MKKISLLAATVLLLTACITNDSKQDIEATKDQTVQSDGAELDVLEPTDLVVDNSMTPDVSEDSALPDLSPVDVVATDELEMMNEDQLDPDACTPQCYGKECGDDGCGGTCGTCPQAAPVCNDFQLCEVGCAPNCDGKECGDDGCGGSCGNCPQAAPFCVDSLCQLECTPSCDGVMCGDDGCGGSCGTCPDGETCVQGTCGLPCPVAVIDCEEGDHVAPQTTLHLTGISSYAGSGNTISQYQWSVVQPEMSQSVFMPSASYPSPTFEPNVVGTYEFALRVWDSDGTPSCAPSKHTVAVLSAEAIHIELLWHTPGDLDETDTGPEAGSDLDLHFVHPMAAGPDVDQDGLPDPWFDNMYDCFWFNSHPNWGSYDPNIDDDPSLDRDDTDGAGPENINYGLPLADSTFRVGVHYWNDHSFGPSTAVLRIYVFGNLAYEVSQELESLDMWDACTISWPGGTVTPITAEGGGAKIAPDYQNPMFSN